ncbi:MAG TPA: serine/threonine-protein kinase [Polyangiaceae bacterium]|jgi:serine/threonine-protein kinase|nr:MAG: Serine/threonine-protein kinase PknB [Deltaproteobacteria bacterium ADurb.Bin207]HNS98345.1 serine/threonine-protein kinase [Polyangiaceae bacterium]HNZ23678.1 serine/threonine-protein kinase [Polyangiaceae bacterium]HOD22406.1 serine/threonine-protein kinase [Polyangiaceae bacterium]HOE51527.1 serine/threonine-protein kinase [Polyangiaceae bacterium]
MQPGDVFADRYRITRILSVGQMATVCAADHTLTRQSVVLKLIRGNCLPGSPDPTAWEVRFRREVRAAAGIDSKHAVRILDAAIDTATGISYLAMEELQGEDLSETIRRIGCFPPHIALRLLSQACHAVQAAHEVGVVHRDIKPSNLFLAENKDGTVTVKLLDFGLAKAFADGMGLMSLADVTDAGKVLGTPSFMSPEQAQDPRRVDHRTDIWSLSAVLYRMLCGQSPFSGPEGTAGTLIELATGSRDPDPVQNTAPWIQPGVAAIVHRGLQRDLRQRYARVEDMHQDILEWLDHQDSCNVAEIVSLSRQQRQTLAPMMTEADLCLGQPRVGFRSAIDEQQPPRSSQTNLRISSITRHLRRWLAVGGVLAGMTSAEGQGHGSTPGTSLLAEGVSPNVSASLWVP